jgi:hypothetical protein
MATRRLGIAHQEIEEVRSRLFLKRWDTMSFDVQARLNELKKLFRAPTNDEIHRHVIVASIAALQTFHRGTIITIVDSGDEYKARAAENVTEKISMKDALTWLGGKAASFGELVAHSAPCNSVTDLLSWLGILLACDIKQALTEAVDPYDLRNEVAAPAKIVADIDQLLIDLAEAFRLRHIFAHEAASAITVSADECGCLLEAVDRWIQAVDAVLWSSVHKDLPLTQYEMNQHAGAEVLAARNELASAMRKALSEARSAGSASWLRNNHFAWMKATTDWTRNTYGSLQGSMWPAVAGSDLAKAIQIRSEQVMDWNNSQDAEGAHRNQ